MGSNVKQLGQYPTYAWAAEAIVERYYADLAPHDFVVEPGCGPGAFLAALPADVPALGIDIDPRMVELARRNTGRRVVQGDFLEVELDQKPTLILGNPPFQLSLVDRFLERAHEVLVDGGRVGFILPAYAFQTAGRVAGYADRWSLMQDLIPRNIFPGLSKPLVFAQFIKDRSRTMIGFALYREAAGVQALPARYREKLVEPGGSVWLRVVEAALSRLGGEADLSDLYAEIEGCRPTAARTWRAKIRQTLCDRHPERFECTGKGRYRRASMEVACA